MSGESMENALSFRRLRKKLSDFKHYVRLWRLDAMRGKHYRKYLRTQLTRTLSKKDVEPGLRAKLLIDRLIDLGSPPPDPLVLCIGCRNTMEMEYFRGKGLSNVIGIDLFSESPDIFVMDMHQMTFPNDHFDIVLASHSLEHAYDVHKVVKEIIRVACPGALVAIEVPVQYETRGADLVDFGNSRNLHAVFEPYIARVLWSDEQPPHTPWNDSGNAVVRTVFTVCKIA